MAHTEPTAGIVSPDPRGQAALLLTESLIHMLVEKSALTPAEAVNVVRSAAEVKLEIARSGSEPKAVAEASLVLLKGIELTFDAVALCDSNRDGPSG